MDPKTKKKIIIGLSVTTILGVGGYFLYQYLKDRADANAEGDVTDDGKSSDTVVTTTTTPVVNPPAKPASQPQGSRPDDILAFQKWANENGYTPKLDEDGLWGPKTKSAWTAKKSDYEKAIGPASGRLSGQLKTIYDKFMASSTLKDVTKIDTASNGAEYVQTVGNKSGKMYFYWPGGLIYVFNTVGTSLMDGVYTNDGLKIVVTSGANQGKTYTGTSILAVANDASTDTNYVKNYTDWEYANIAAKMYDAMKGAGTKDQTFANQWSKLKSYADWSQTSKFFGKHDGQSLFQWMAGESALMHGKWYNKAYFNKWFKDRGSGNRF